MIRLLYLLSRRSDISQSEFNDHWGGHHVDVHGRPEFGLRRYVRYAVHEPPSSAAGPAYDGAVSVWCDDEGSLSSLMARAMARAGDDERRFIDHAASRALVVDDAVVAEPLYTSTVVSFECLSIESPDRNEVLDVAKGTVRDYAEDALLGGLVVSFPRSESGAADSFDGLGSNAQAWNVIVGYYFDSRLAARLFIESGASLGATMGARVSARKILSAATRISIREPVR